MSLKSKVNHGFSSSVFVEATGRKLDEGPRKRRTSCCQKIPISSEPSPWSRGDTIRCSKMHEQRVSRISSVDFSFCARCFLIFCFWVFVCPPRFSTTAYNYDEPRFQALCLFFFRFFLHLFFVFFFSSIQTTRCTYLCTRKSKRKAKKKKILFGGEKEVRTADAIRRTWKGLAIPFAKKSRKNFGGCRVKGVTLQRRE